MFVSSALFVACPPVGGLRAPGDDQHFRCLGRTVSAGGDVARLGSGDSGGVSHWKISATLASSPPVGVEILSVWVLPTVLSCLLRLGGVQVAACIPSPSLEIPWPGLILLGQGVVNAIRALPILLSTILLRCSMPGFCCWGVGSCSVEE